MVSGCQNSNELDPIMGNGERDNLYKNSEKRGSAYYCILATKFMLPAVAIRRELVLYRNMCMYVLI